MKFALTCFYDDNYVPLGDLTWKENKKQYCERHNYQHLGFKYNTHGDHTSHGFIHMQIINKIFNDPKNSFDWLWKTGCDSMITNMTVKLESIVEKYATDKTHLIVAKDMRGVNVDSFLLKNSDKSRKFVDDIYNLKEKYKNTHWMEQQAIIDYCKSTFIEETVYVPQKTFNSYNYEFYKDLNPPYLDETGENGQWEKGDFLFHWPGVGINDRINLYYKHKEDIIE